MNLLTTPCPHCQHPEMPEPPRTPRPFAACPNCGLKSRAALSETKDGQTIVTYRSTARPKLPPGQVKQTRTIRLSDDELAAIERGDIGLTVKGGRIVKDYSKIIQRTAAQTYPKQYYDMQLERPHLPEKSSQE